MMVTHAELPKEIVKRVKQPTPEEVKAARLRAGLNQEQAASLVSAASSAPRRTWAGYEKADGQNKRKIPLAVWELFLLLTNQHPTCVLAPISK